MRNTRGLLMIALAAVAGVAAMLLATRWLSMQTSIATNTVAVAAADLSVGQPIGPDQIRIVEWPSGSVPAGAFASKEALKDRVARTNVLRDEPILESRLAPKGTRGGLSAVIADGKRAITVRVNDVVGVAGFALPGNHVDVIVNTRDERGDKRDRDNMVSKIVLERILVLAIAQEASRDDTKPKVVNAVTLEVTPEEAEKIDLARSVGTLSLVLRNQIDPDEAKTAGATKDSLLDLRPTAPPPIAAKTPSKSKPVVVARAVDPTPAAAQVREQTCVDALVGKQRRQECF
jgi:pilus assembly protein CpaB